MGEIQEIVIVDDHRLYRQALSTMLSSQLENANVKDVANSKILLDLVEQKNYRPNIIIVDLEMPVMSGIKAARSLLTESRLKDTKIIVLTVYDDRPRILKLIEDGVHAYLLKGADSSEILKAIDLVQNGQYYVSDGVFNAIKEDTYDTQLSRKLGTATNMLSLREQEVLMLICKEYTNKKMADALKLSVRTIDGHRNRLLKKTGKKNTVGLVKYAIRNGIYLLD